MSISIRKAGVIAWGLGLMLMVPVAWAQISRPDISNVYVFGDSLSDNGSGIALIDGGCRDALLGGIVCGQRRDSVKLGAPFHQGRSISDGPVAVEVMATLLGKPLRPGNYIELLPGIERAGENYAISGAHAHGARFNVNFALERQIDAYQRHYKHADPKALYVLFIGANDVLSAIDHHDVQQVDMAVAALQAGVNRLSALGARRILVYKLLSLSDVPKYVEKPELRERATEFTARFNAGIDALTTPAGALHRFDMQAFWTFAKQFAHDYQVDYRTACVAPASDLFELIKQSPDRNVTVTPGYLPACDAKQRDRRVFFDALHPSGYMHQLLGHASYDFVVERLTNQCALHAWSADAAPDRGEPNVRRGLPGSVYRYDNPYNGKREYLRLTHLGNDSAYWYFPIDGRDNTYWQNLGTQPPAQCGTAFRASMNYWGSRLLQGGVATGEFARAKKGDTFLYNNPYLGKPEYFTFLDPYGNGTFWYFPIDGVSPDFWWERTSVK